MGFRANRARDRIATRERDLHTASGSLVIGERRSYDPHMPVPERPLDPDFSRDVLEDLYAYRRKRRSVAWLLWTFLGLLGAHRFYLERPFSGTVQLFTAGGAFAWWLIDAGRINGMVREHNAEQAARERDGRPPLEMEGMPALRDEELCRVPDWVTRWSKQSRTRRALRFAGDALVLLVAGTGLGALVGTDGALEAVAAVVLLAGMTSLGAGPAWLDDVPGFRALVRWTHRLRVFYYHNEPGSPPTLLLRAMLGVLWAPFRSKNRTEVRLYVELGAAFAAFFLLLDIIPEAVVPMLSASQEFQLGALLEGWLAEAISTFLFTYALAAPVGGVLTLHVLIHRTHTVPRILAVFTLVAVGLGLVAV